MALLVPAIPGHVPSPSKVPLEEQHFCLGDELSPKAGAVGIFQLFHTSGSKECCLSPLVSDISWVMEQERIEKATQGLCLSDFVLAVSEPIAGRE